MQIKIKNLKLRTIIGINRWEREKKQDIVVNILIAFDASSAVLSDNIEDTVDYKTITKNIIDMVEGSQFYLLEKLGRAILKIVLDNKRVSQADVEIDKPQALRFTDSVSVKTSGANENA